MSLAAQLWYQFPRHTTRCLLRIHPVECDRDGFAILSCTSCWMKVVRNERCWFWRVYFMSSVIRACADTCQYCCKRREKVRRAYLSFDAPEKKLKCESWVRRWWVDADDDALQQHNWSEKCTLIVWRTVVGLGKGRNPTSLPSTASVARSSAL